MFFYLFLFCAVFIAVMIGIVHAAWYYAIHSEAGKHKRGATSNGASPFTIRADSVTPKGSHRLLVTGTLAGPAPLRGSIVYLEAEQQELHRAFFINKIKAGDMPTPGQGPRMTVTLIGSTKDLPQGKPFRLTNLRRRDQLPETPKERTINFPLVVTHNRRGLLLPIIMVLMGAFFFFMVFAGIRLGSYDFDFACGFMVFCGAFFLFFAGWAILENLRFRMTFTAPDKIELRTISRTLHYHPDNLRCSTRMDGEKKDCVLLQISDSAGRRLGQISSNDPHFDDCVILLRAADQRRARIKLWKQLLEKEYFIPLQPGLSGTGVSVRIPLMRATNTNRTAYPAYESYDQMIKGVEVADILFRKETVFQLVAATRNFTEADAVVFFLSSPGLPKQTELDRELWQELQRELGLGQPADTAPKQKNAQSPADPDERKQDGKINPI